MRATEVKRKPMRLKTRLQHLEVEIDNIPPREDIRIDLLHPRRQCFEQSALVGMTAQIIWIGRRRFAHQMNLLYAVLGLGAAADQRHRVDLRGVRRGLDVEHQQRQLRLAFNRR